MVMFKKHLPYAVIAALAALFLTILPFDLAGTNVLAVAGIFTGLGLCWFAVYKAVLNWQGATFVVFTIAIIIMIGLLSAVFLGVSIKYANLTYNAAMLGAYADAGIGLFISFFALAMCSIIVWVGAELTKAIVMVCTPNS